MLVTRTYGLCGLYFEQPEAVKERYCCTKVIRWIMLCKFCG